MMTLFDLIFLIACLKDIYFLEEETLAHDSVKEIT